MIFTSQKSRKKELLHFLHKKYKYNRDLLTTKKLELYLQLELEIKDFLKNSSASAESIALGKVLEERALKLFPPEKDSEWKENVEVLFVAVVIALALRTFFLQPFVIPTDSMKPTLYGIQTEPAKVSPPGFFQQVTDFLLFGNSYVQVRVDKGGMVKNISDTGWFGVDLLGYIPFVDRTRLVIGNETYILAGTPEEFKKGTLGYKPGMSLEVGMDVPDNSTPVNYVFGAGDHVFVNKFIYNFRKPERGDVFVFTTEGIRGLEQRLGDETTSQFYIKRCVGLPGDELSISPPYLFSNGKKFEPRPVYEKIYSAQGRDSIGEANSDGYRGYSTGDPRMNFLGSINETYQIPANGYWAMGDNSYNSLDSRFWGTVPAENLVGTGWLVYWPFSKRWGLIP